MTEPLFTSQASRMQPTTSSAPAWTTRLRMGSEPRTPMLTMHWNAREKRYAACLSYMLRSDRGQGLRLG